MEASKSLWMKHEEGSTTPRSIIGEGPSSSASCNNWKSVVLKRRKVEQALVIFRDLFSELLCEYKADQLGHFKAKLKALTEAAMLMRKKYQWENTRKRVGHIPGIEVGDRFQYRTELNIIGLHRQFSCGIDYMGKGRNSLATSIVVTHRYANVRKSSGSLVYIGQGGNPNAGYNVVPHDQKLEAGNLALKNSMEAKSPVRVILKVYGKFGGLDTWSYGNSSNYSFIYDGLYLVEKMTQDRGKLGKLVFKFIMNRILEQPTTCVGHKDVLTKNDNESGGFASVSRKMKHKSKRCLAQKDVVRVSDVSNGQEKLPIRVVTDSDQMPTFFDYIVNTVYSERMKQPMLSGCECADGCVDLHRCACIVRNGGRISYDCNKKLTSCTKSSDIYECGPSCKCFSSCMNRVSQYGIQFQLEIFKTELKGWGVRTRSFIPAGSFVCEYIGEVCDYREAGSRLDVDDYIFNIGAGKGFIDATKCGNIGRFINHSCSPNLLVRDVIYHKSFPHKMLFAVKDIPAGRELSYDYNCRKGRMPKVESNVCYCGSQECIRHIYT